MIGSRLEEARYSINRERKKERKKEAVGGYGVNSEGCFGRDGLGVVTNVEGKGRRREEEKERRRERKKERKKERKGI